MTCAGLRRVGDVGVGDGRPDLAAHELGGGVVGGAVEREVVVGGEEEEATLAASAPRSATARSSAVASRADCSGSVTRDPNAVGISRLRARRPR